MLCKKAIVVGLMAALFAAGCGGDRVAKVNGRSISKKEFDAYLAHKHLPAGDAKQTAAALKEYAEREALADVIEDEGLLDETALEVELNEFRKEMLISRYFDQFLKENVTDQAVANYYNAHPEQYQEKRVHVAHILIRTQREMDESERKAKLTTAQEVQSNLKAGKAFEELAASYSEDKVSAKKGGDLGLLKEGAISKAFSEKVFGMKKGEISEPFETPFGFHIVKVLEEPQTIKKPLEAVKGDIRYQLRNQARDAELARLLKDTDVEIKE